MTLLFEPLTEVRLKNDPSTQGLTTGCERKTSNGRVMIEVRVIGKGIKQYPLDQLEEVSAGTDIVDNIRDGKFLSPKVLRTVLIHIQLSGRLADMIYSMEATNTEYYPFQFKPVIKLINSPSNSLLIADEVGLGKTIEAGLIWTEIKARFDAKNVIILCPFSLTKKWQTEFSNKFDVRAEIYSAKQMVDLLNDRAQLLRGGAYICAMQSLRPDRGWENSEEGIRRKNQQVLAKMLDELKEGNPVFDLLIVDEAHHLRNSDTQIYRLGHLFRTVSDYAVFLSATPIHLKNENLLSQLSILDPGTFPMENKQELLRSFENLLEANRPILAAKELIEKGQNRLDASEKVREALQNTLLVDSKILASCLTDLSKSENELTNSERTSILTKLDIANLMSNIVTRTRRRDVNELRVVRRVKARRLSMNNVERKFYDDVSLAVKTYADINNITSNFLLVSPQRMMASCMYGALSHWRNGETIVDENQEADLMNNNINEKPLIEFMRQKTLNFNLNELRASDTKYKSLRKILINYFQNEKTILFSSFKPTLRYLRERLDQDGLKVVQIDGDTLNRNDLLDEFAAYVGQIILLSSEVGSEGLDLQFCQTLINYDLPWNPMKVEQRIGRIDRVGQQSERIIVLNFMHKNTIDQRIWDRLYERLKLCEQALGGFEDIIGDEIKKIGSFLLSDLSTEEQNARLEQSAQAIENKKMIDENLERDASGLMAHGDYILIKVKQAHQFQRWITADDIQKYIAGFFADYFPRSKIAKESDKNNTFKITLDSEVKIKFFNYCTKMNLRKNTLMITQSSAIVCFGKPLKNKVKLLETINQQHPLIRFATETIMNEGKIDLRPAVIGHLDKSVFEIEEQEVIQAEITEGLYLVVVQLWSISGLTQIEKLSYAGTNMTNGESIDDNTAEILANKMTISGKPADDLLINNEKIALVAKNLFDKLDDQFDLYCSERLSELEDRVSFQKRNLDQQLKYQNNVTYGAVNKLKIKKQLTTDPKKLTNLDSLIKAQIGKFEKLEQKYLFKKQQLTDSLIPTDDITRVAAIIAKVT